MNVPSEKMELLIQKAKDAADFAYVPYSDCPIGAALMTKEGNIYTGANIEGAAYTTSVCAEKVALLKAISEGKYQFTDLVIWSDNVLPAPCGACLQSYSEFVQDDMDIVIVFGAIVERYTLNELLPKAFRL